MPDYSSQIREMGAFVRGEGDAPVSMPADRAAVYRELVFGSVSGLLQTNLPRTHSLLGDAWNPLIETFIASRVAVTPYFHEVAAAFSAFVDARDGVPLWLPDLVHFEALQLAVETSSDETDVVDGWSLSAHTQIAAYNHDVLQNPPHAQPTFVVITRDPDGVTHTTPLLAVDFAVLSTLSEISTPNVSDHWRSQVLETYLAKGVVRHSGTLVR